MTTEKTEDLDPGMEVGASSVPTKTTTQGGAVSTFRDDQAYLAVIETRNRFLELAIPLAVSVTRASDWQKYGDKVRPEIAAVNQIMRRFAISRKNVRYEKMDTSDEKGQYYIYTCYATFALPTALDEIEAVGTGSMRDLFLGSQGEKNRPRFEIKEDHIQKKALANCTVNGVVQLLGLNSMTVKDLKGAGVQGDVHEVQFKDGKTGGKAKAKARTKAQAKPPPDQAPPIGESAPVGTGPNDPAPEEKRQKAIAEFNETMEHAKGLNVDPQEIVDKYMILKDGSTPKIESIQNFKRNNAVNWLIDKTKEIRKEEGFFQ